MSRAPRVTGPDLIAALAKDGFHVLRVKGSHHFLRHADGRNTVVPAHASETIGPGLLHKILRDCQMTAERLSELLEVECGTPLLHIDQVDYDARGRAVMLSLEWHVADAFELIVNRRASPGPVDS